MNGASSKTFRQTFLPFKPVAPSSVTSKVNLSKCDTKIVKFTAEIPAEIWCMVFECLQGCTYDLKPLRLVCRYWAKVGAENLFRVAYLDSFRSSWSKLKRLCQSPYALCVKTIHWTPLMLYEDYLDADVWTRDYPNLLGGAGHALTVQLHEAYCRTYWQSIAEKPPASFDVDALIEVSSTLRNCHELVLSDNFDFESRCADEVTSRRLQNDTTLWKTNSMWGRSPRVRGQNAEVKVFTGMNVLKLSEYLKMVTRLKIDLWDTTFNLLEFGPLGASYPAFTTLCLNLKSCNMGADDGGTMWFNREFYGPYLGRSSTSHFISRCPKIQNLCLGTTYADPGTAYVRKVEEDRLHLEEWEGDLASELDGPEPIQAATQFSELEERQAREWPCGFTLAMISAHQTRLNLRFFQTSRLRNITLSNLSIDLRSLVFWLIDLHELPRKAMSLRFSGHVFLHSLEKFVFLAILAALNVGLFCHPDTAFCRGDIVFEDHSDFLLSLPQSQDDGSGYHDLYAWPNSKICEFLPDCCPSNLWNSGNIFDDSSDARIRVDFADCPQKWKDIKAKSIGIVRETGRRLSFLYCYSELPSKAEAESKNHRLVFQWTEESIYVSPPSGSPPLHALVRLDIHDHQRDGRRYRGRAFYASPVEAQSSAWKRTNIALVDIDG